MILVVGGGGYIGSVVIEELEDSNYEVVVLDNFKNGHKESVPEDIPVFEGEMNDEELLAEIFDRYNISAVMHFASLIEAGESVKKPRLYWNNNFVKSRQLVDICNQQKINKIIFSSTAAVYGEPVQIPIPEDHPKDPMNAYGKSKLAFEHYLTDLYKSDNIMNVRLRYFNAAGAGKNAGEDHTPETHLIPITLETALGQREKMEIYGTNYNTRDSTCLRDFIHVKDLARAHRVALEEIKTLENEAINLGSGTGYTVAEVIEKTKEITGVDFQVAEAPPRPGDPSKLVADYKKASKLLGWTPEHNLDQIIQDAWTWKKQHPTGYP